MPVIEKRLKTQLESKDPRVLYSTNTDEQIKRLLEVKYLNKCFKCCLITEIVRIIMRSPLISDSERSGGVCRFSVDFVVQAVVYDRHEVIPQADVVEILENGMISLSTPHAYIGISNDPRLQAVKVGDKIPVRVVNSRYQPMTDRISVQAIPYVAMAEQDAEYYITVRDDDIKKMAGVMPSHDEKGDSRYELVREIIYPYETQVRPPAGSRIVRLGELISGAYVVSQPTWLTDPLTCLVRDPQNSDGKVLDNSVQILKGMVHNADKKLRLISQLATMYKFDKSEKHIWQIYRNSKLPDVISAKPVQVSTAEKSAASSPPVSPRASPRAMKVTKPAS